MKKEYWTIKEIREFVEKGYQSVAARMTKCLLEYYDEKQSENVRLKKLVFEAFKESFSPHLGEPAEAFNAKWEMFCNKHNLKFEGGTNVEEKK